jgi:hypothetical protein
MVLMVILYGYVFILAVLYGVNVLLLIPVARDGRRPVSITALVGLAVLAAFAGILSLWINLGLAANLLILLVGVSASLLQRRRMREFFLEKMRELRGVHWLTALVFLAIFVVVLVRSVQLPQNYDTGLYHAQTIRWMETYRAIPGLGNLADRLVFNSNWLLLSALFHGSFTGAGPFHALGGLLAILVCGYALGKADRLLKGDLTLSNLTAILLPFVLRRLFSLEFSSPGTDLPAALLVWILLTLSLEKLEEGSSARLDFSFVAITILSLFAVTVKLSTLPVLVLPLYFLWQAARGSRGLPAKIVIPLALLLTLPWMARSYVQSGYLVYPLPQTAMFHPDWQIPAENVRGTAGWIRSWAKIATPDRESVEKMSLLTWVPVWYKALPALDRQVILLNILALALLAARLVFLSIKDGLRKTLISPPRVVDLVALAGIVFWFFQAPAMRFGYAFLGIFPVLVLVPYLHTLFCRLPRLSYWATMLLLVLLLGYQGVSLLRLDTGALRPLIVQPAGYPEVPVEAHSLGGFTIYTPSEGDQCWYSPFPCAPRIEKETQPRGDRLVDGFRTAP